MEEIGEILHVLQGNRAIAKVKVTPKIGSTVYDRRRKPIGQIIDIFGPVKLPYVEIDVKGRSPQKIINSTIYILPKIKSIRGRDRDGRR